MLVNTAFENQKPVKTAAFHEASINEASTLLAVKLNFRHFVACINRTKATD